MFYPISFVQGSAAPVSMSVPQVSRLPSSLEVRAPSVVVLDSGSVAPLGLYVNTSQGWRRILDLETLSLAIGAGDIVTVLVNQTGTTKFLDSIVYANGIMVPDTSVTASTAVWCVRTPNRIAVNNQAYKSARVVAVANHALTGLGTIDGKTLVENDIVLLTDQVTGTENGLWSASAGAWTRPLTWPSGKVQKEGVVVIVAEGDAYHDGKWFCTTDGDMTIDTTPTTWVQDPLNGTLYTASAGVALVGTDFQAALGDGLELDNADNIQIKIGTGLTSAAGAIMASLGDGLELDNADAIQIKIGTGLTSASGALKASIGDGLELDNADAIQVKLGTGLELDVGKAVQLDLGAGLVLNSNSVEVDHTVGAGFPKYSDFITNETPTGALDGVNAAFVLANTPLAGLQVFIDGVLITSGYTVATATITFGVAPTGTTIKASYIK